MASSRRQLFRPKVIQLVGSLAIVLSLLAQYFIIVSHFPSQEINQGKLGESLKQFSRATVTKETTATLKLRDFSNGCLADDSRQKVTNFQPIRGLPVKPLDPVGEAFEVHQELCTEALKRRLLPLESHVNRRSWENVDKKCIRELGFLHVPKTGGSTIVEMAKKKSIKWADLLWEDWPKPKFHADRKQLWWHTPIQYIDVPQNFSNPYAGQDLFAVTRNPYNRVIR